MVLKTAGFGLADVQSDVFLPSRLHVIAVSIDQLLRRRLFMIRLPICQWGASSRRCFKSLVSP